MRSFFFEFPVLLYGFAGKDAGDPFCCPAIEKFPG
jgi:hypothetical protein